MPRTRPNRRDPFREATEPGDDEARSPSGAASVDEPDLWEPDDGYLDGIDDPSRVEVPAGPSGEGVPAVVAVVVTSDPREWFDDTLRGLQAQDYPGLSVLVIDVATSEDLASRVASILPTAFVKRLERPVGWAEAIDSVLDTVEGAPFLLICHDDVELAPGAVQAMVEEAFRSNAGIVGAKLVDWVDPTRIRSVGWTIDKFAFTAPMAEPGELDQAQHDAAREAFAVSSAAMLVRADLFADLGGFATDLGDVSADLDLCWRARIAGAKAVVMPAASARHRERSGAGDVQARQRREVLRTQGRLVLSNYTPLHLLRVVPQAVAMAAIDLIAAVASGRWALAKDIAAAMTWNVVHLPGTLRRRGGVKRIRRVDDGEIRRMHVGGSVRIEALARGARALSGVRGREAMTSARDLPGTLGGAGLAGYAAFVAVTLLVVLGSRGLITGKVSVLGELGVIDGVRPLLRSWWTGWRGVGLGHEAASPGLVPLAGVLGVATFGSFGAVRLALVLGPVLLGIWGAWRLGAVVGGRGRPFLAVAYTVNPIVFDAIAGGRLSALGCYAAVPWIARQLLAPPAGPDDVGRHTRASGAVARPGVSGGLALAAGMCLAPFLVVETVVVALAALAAAPLRGDPATHSPRLVLQRLGVMAAVAALVHLPWTVALLTDGWRPALLRVVGAGDRTGWRELLGFATPSLGGIVSVGLVVGAVFVLLVGAGERLRLGWSGWIMIVASWGLVAVGSRLHGSWGLPHADVLLVPAALGVALAVGAGVNAYDHDVRALAFGWRQLAAAACGSVFVLGCTPFVTAALDGRWNQPGTDVVDVLGPLAEGGDSFRTVWVGEPDGVVTGGSPLGSGIAVKVTDGVVPRVDAAFAPSDGRGEQQLHRSFSAALDGSTIRLGRFLAAQSVRYIVVADPPSASVDRGSASGSAAARLRDVLDGQAELRRLDAVPGLRVYENARYLPIRSNLVAGSEAAGVLGALAGSDLTRLATSSTLTADPVLGVVDRPVSFGGDLVAGTVVHTANDEGEWFLDVDGAEVAASESMGWAQQFEVTNAGTGSLAHRTSLAHRLMVVVSVLFLAVAVTGLVPGARRRVGPLVDRLRGGRSSGGRSSGGDGRAEDGA